MAGSGDGKKRARREVVEDGPKVERLRVDVPVLVLPGMERAVVRDQRLRLSSRQAQAQRALYDALAHERAIGESLRRIGVNSPHWHATAWLLDRLADEMGLA